MSLKAVWRNLVTGIGWRLPAFPERRVVPLMYHGIPNQPDALGLGREVFERQILFLRDHFRFVGPEEITRESAKGGPRRILLTFDDGFRNNARVVASILQRLSIPAVFFVATRHLQPRRWLWFVYLRALEEQYPENKMQFRGEVFDFSRKYRKRSAQRIRRSLLQLRPHPEAVYQAIEDEFPAMEQFTNESVRADRYDGMSEAELASLANNPLFTFGAHTADHPLLTLCSAKEQKRQIERGRKEIERVTGRHCDLFAYPGDDHDPAVRTVVSAMGFRAVFSVHRTLNVQPWLAIPRVGVYYPSLPELGFKIQWNGLLRQLQQWNPATRS